MKPCRPPNWRGGSAMRLACAPGCFICPPLCCVPVPRSRGGAQPPRACSDRWKSTRSSFATSPDGRSRIRWTRASRRPQRGGDCGTRYRKWPQPTYPAAAIIQSFGMAMINRQGGRRADQLRGLSITRHYARHAEGSALIECGQTLVLCTASVEEGVPPFRKGKGSGWLTAEYGMLPRATNTRMRREAAEGKQSGRTQEIQRLIGRSLRAGAELSQWGERTIRLDCDVIQADGGTRCASITGACVALYDAVAWCRTQGLIQATPLRDLVAADSVGIVAGELVLDLDY